MEVAFSPGLVPPDNAGGPPPASQAELEQRTNFVMRMIFRQMASLRVKKVDHLSPNIGYLQVSGFPPGFLMAESYGAAMDKLADTDGLIVDMRDNRGGGPESVALLVSYFVDQRTRLNDIWDRDTGITTAALDGQINLTANAMAARSPSSSLPAQVRCPPAKTSPIRCRQ